MAADALARDEQEVHDDDQREVPVDGCPAVRLRPEEAGVGHVLERYDVVDAGDALGARNRRGAVGSWGAASTWRSPQNLGVRRSSLRDCPRSDPDDPRTST